MQGVAPRTRSEVVGWRYADMLQRPLQPLRDDLTAQVYTAFEQDCAKYAAYESAVGAFLADFKQRQSYDADGHVSVLVPGAGRGGLVHSVMNASKTTGVRVAVLALEKNLSAVSDIIQSVACYEGQPVFVCPMDMRSMSLDVLPSSTLEYFGEGVDCIVSELLGSFGDNELSPECLDGVLPLLKPGGVSIPASSTSYIAPVSSYVLWNAVRTFGANTRADEFATSASSFHQPYVVSMNMARLVSDPVAMFSFVHVRQDNCRSMNNGKSGDKEGNKGGQGMTKNVGVASSYASEQKHGATTSPLHEHVTANGSGSSNLHNRFHVVTFGIPHGAVIHGLVGYFHAHLYGEHTLSIVPQLHTDGLFSWFPLLFPLAQGVQARKGDLVSVSMRRRVEGDHVWYEWCLSCPGMTTGIHNGGGKYWKIGLARARLGR